jgi:hypothetical protein
MRGDESTSFLSDIDQTRTQYQWYVVTSWGFNSASSCPGAVQ